MSAKQKQKNKTQLIDAVQLCWTDESWEDYQYWYETDTAIFDKINELIKDIQRTPFTGIGKPEGLKGDLSGFFSRRITKEHRLVYLYQTGVLYIAGCRYHYDD